MDSFSPPRAREPALPGPNKLKRLSSASNGSALSRSSTPSRSSYDGGERERERSRTTSQASIPTSNSFRSISDIPLAPLPHHLAPFLLPDSPLSNLEKRELFTATYLKAASAGHADTLEWLLSVPESTLQSFSVAAAQRRFSASSLSSHSRTSSLQPADEADAFPENAPRKWIDVEATDEDGNTALGLCVALGHAEGVRVLVEGGASVAGGDKGAFLSFDLEHTCELRGKTSGIAGLVAVRLACSTSWLRSRTEWGTAMARDSELSRQTWAGYPLRGVAVGAKHWLSLSGKRTECLVERSCPADRATHQS